MQGLTNSRFYDGGKITDANRRDFPTAGLSTFEDLAQPDRDTLRARARYLAGNNPVMANIDGAILDNVIGTGILLQSRIGKQKIDDEIERLWKIWTNDRNLCDSSGKLTFPNIQKLLLQTRMIDGEVFIYKRYTPEGLQLQIIEADALDGGQDNGVEKDGTGKITGYRFKIANADGSYSSKTMTIKTENIINYYKSERFSQDRGVSEYKQAITDIKNFQGYQTATIQSARARASIAYTVKADVNPHGMGVTEEDKRLQEVNGVMVYYLQQGESIDKQAPQGSSDDYKSFVETTIRMIATSRRISYELAFRDYSKVNFASSRASLIQDWKRFDAEQTHFIEYVLNDVYSTWLEIEIMRGNIKIPLNKFVENKHEYLKQRWITPKRAYVDPLKDSLAIEKEISMNLTTQTDQALKQGLDFEEVIAKKAQEVEILKKYGMYIEPEADTGSGDAQSPTQEMADAREMQERLEFLEEQVQNLDDRNK